MRVILRMSSRFGGDLRGNVAVIFALAIIPVLTMVGAAVDYSRATQLKSKIQAAADAASVGSIAKNSTAFIAAGNMTGDGTIPGGAADATNIFNGNVSGLAGVTINSVTPTVTKSGSTLTSVISYSADVPTSFMGVIGKTSLTVTGTSTSSANMPQYIDFYVLLDNSPSMGVGATPTDVATMVNNTSDKCAFACHDLSNSNNYYKLAKSLSVTTRMDVLRQATQNLMSTAQSTQTYSTQFRMAIYDFGGSSDTQGLRSLFALSSSLSSAQTAAGNIDLMTVNGQNDNNDQDTGFSAIMPAIDTAITTPGNGSSGSPLKYLFFVSDGVADEYNPSKCLKSTTGGRCQSPIDPTLCDNMKNRGVKIAVLYTTYLQLPTNPWYMTWIDPFNAGPWGPSPNSQIAQKMQACASPGFYFEVSPTQGISEAMNTLFAKAVMDARISK
ncbi:TadE/TadG family type IV pilus assembly protein [Bradyrhizobium sp.]|uniref:TadE/TadG family type IV pilus assembly protein n=1 Tax=Bradyrhizobium sp. TaxID=376 RepID=UPI002D01CA78|nr:TadE/TadG family type IV pilus assembly protein [Bradyrhizobium sp.]HWX62179.1 TadE/TadG family type IV pilus assembly protein [Bradyrhizobium sp.]